MLGETGGRGEEKGEGRGRGRKVEEVEEHGEEEAWCSLNPSRGTHSVLSMESLWPFQWELLAPSSGPPSVFLIMVVG